MGSLVERGVVLGLLVAMSNTEHPESCKHAIDAVLPITNRPSNLLGTLDCEFLSLTDMDWRFLVIY